MTDRGERIGPAQLFVITIDDRRDRKMPDIKLNKRFYPTENWEEMTPEEKRQ